MFISVLVHVCICNDKSIGEKNSFFWYSNFHAFVVHCVKSVQIRSFFWSVFSCIRTVRIKENTDQKKLRIWTLFTQWWQSSAY